MRTFIAGFTMAVLLAACSSTNTSGLRATGDVNSIPDLSRFNAVVVPDFTDGTIKQNLPKKAGAQYAFEVSKAIADTKAFDIVSRQGDDLEGKTVLSVQGEIDRFAESDTVDRYLSAYTDGDTSLDATINFVDLASGEVLGSMEIDRSSFALGGIFAVNATLDKFMAGTSKNIAKEVAEAKKN